MNSPGPEPDAGATGVVGETEDHPCFAGSDWFASGEFGALESKARRNMPVALSDSSGSCESFPELKSFMVISKDRPRQVAAVLIAKLTRPGLLRKEIVAQ